MAKTDLYVESLKVFTGNMRRRFRQKASKGFTGWNDPQKMERKQVITRIVTNLMDDHENGEVDAANLCLFLWHLRTQEKAK